MANPFYIQPSSATTGTLEGLSKLMMQAGQIRDRRKAQERLAQGRQTAQEAYASGDINEMRKVAIANPELSGILDKAITFQSERTKDNYLDSLMRAYADPSQGNLEQIVMERKQLLGDEGVSPENQKETDSFLMRFQQNPEGTKKNLAMELAMRLPADKWKQFRQATGIIDQKDRYKIVEGRLVDISDPTGPQVVLDAQPKSLTDLGLVKIGKSLVDISNPNAPKTIFKEQVAKKGPDLKDILSFRKQVTANPIVKEFLTISTQAERMNQAVKDIKAQQKEGKVPNYIAVDQTLITIINKMLDPTSVVRESEYARTSEDQAIISQIKGKIEKLRTGGAGLTDVERNAVIRMSRRFANISKKRTRKEVNSYKNIARKYKIDFNDITSPVLRDIKEEETKEMFGEQQKQATAPQAAISDLQTNPNLSEQFKQKYGYLPEGF